MMVFVIVGDACTLDDHNFLVYTLGMMILFILR